VPRIRRPSDIARRRSIFALQGLPATPGSEVHLHHGQEVTKQIVWSAAMAHDVKYWFPAKRYGWGWGFPIIWQGWAALIGFLALLVAGFLIIPPRHAPAPLIAYAITLGILFAGLYWWKGEPPRRRWGKE
jgi:hypothetical protein